MQNEQFTFFIYHSLCIMSTTPQKFRSMYKKQPQYLEVITIRYFKTIPLISPAFLTVNIHFLMLPFILYPTGHHAVGKNRPWF